VTVLFFNSKIKKFKKSQAVAKP